MQHGFEVPTRDTVEPRTREIFDGLEKKTGMVPNLYAFIGHSAHALESYLAFQQAQARGSFNAREREAVFLAVSQVNGCRYGQAAHTAVGRLNGFSDDEMLRLRAGTHPDPELAAIVALARAITLGRGRDVDPALVRAFIQAGHDAAALVDLVALIADKTLANYLHNLTGFPVDFPAAEPLEAPARIPMSATSFAHRWMNSSTMYEPNWSGP